MLLTPHAAAGIAISQHVHNPLAVLGLSILSHFVLDLVPHGDQKIFGGNNNEPYRWKPILTVEIIDIAILIAIVAWMAGQPLNTSTYLMTFGVLGGVLPDLLSSFFPVLHARMSWLWLVRWIYRLTKPTGLRYFARGHNWLHNVFHHRLIHRDITFGQGLVLQTVAVVVFLLLAS